MQHGQALGERQAEAGALVTAPGPRVQLLELCEQAIEIGRGYSNTGV